MINQEEQKILDKEILGYTREDIMLSDFMSWAINTYPRLRHKIFHIGNEGNRGGKAGILDGMKALSMGKLAGVPDVCLIDGDKVLWIEFKLKRGIVSDKQMKLHTLWRECGQKVVIVRTFAQFRDAVLSTF
jgi:hypothetical protein